MWPFTPPRQPKTLPMTGPFIDRDSAPEEWQAFLPA
jgi:hypothetical protein